MRSVSPFPGLSARPLFPTEAVGFSLYSPLRGQEETGPSGPVRGRNISAHGFSRGWRNRCDEALERATQYAPNGRKTRSVPLARIFHYLTVEAHNKPRHVVRKAG